MKIICITCNKQIYEAIWDERFYGNILSVFTPFIVMTILVILFALIAAKRYPSTSPVPLLTASLVCGIGFGGFIDGIVLHQILQWHEMISNRLPPVDFVSKSVNMFWDGVFHAFTLFYAVTGVVLMWKAMIRPENLKSGKLLAGGLLMGWGIFNLGEGIIDHHLLKLHNVREVSTHKDDWNFSFLVLSILLTSIGFLIARSRSADSK